MPHISTSAGLLFYVRRGLAGPAIVCLHGAGGTHSHWGYQLRDLHTFAQVYALDLPGHGRSPPPGRTTIGDYSAALLGWMDALDIPQVLLVGHSMGGAIALWTALHTPGRVLGLGLIGTGGRLRVRQDILTGFDQDVPATLQLIVDSSYAPDTSPNLRQQGLSAYSVCDPVVYQGDFLACDRFDLLDRLAGICCPTLIVCGSEDRMTPPKYSQALRDRIAGAKLILVPRAGHMVMLEQPAAVSNGLLHMIQQLPIL